MASNLRDLFRDPIVLTFTDVDDHQLLEVTNPPHVPRAGENVRLGGAPYVVEQVGYDYRDGDLTAIWARCRRA